MFVADTSPCTYRLHQAMALLLDRLSINQGGLGMGGQTLGFEWNRFGSSVSIGAGRGQMYCHALTRAGRVTGVAGKGRHLLKIESLL